jgi:curved DNA-binding protein CbpA
MTRSRAAALLGVEPDADADDVKSAFREYARTHHPDRGGDSEQFDDAVAARDVLLRASARPARQRVFRKRQPWWRQLRTRRL